MNTDQTATAGREAEPLELFGDVACGLFSAGRARTPAFELVGCEVVDVCAQALGVGRAGVGGVTLRDGGGGDERERDEREKELAA